MILLSRKILQLLLLSFLILTNPGCIISKNFPICMSLSKKIESAEKPGITKNLFEACKEHNITIIVLSSTIAEFSGFKKDMKWLQKNYHILICDFDQDSVTADRQVYSTCMTNSQTWIDIVQGPHPENLMNSNAHFEDVCTQVH